jgi:hypothetical protein
MRSALRYDCSIIAVDYGLHWPIGQALGKDLNPGGFRRFYAVKTYSISEL